MGSHLQWKFHAISSRTRHGKVRVDSVMSQGGRPPSREFTLLPSLMWPCSHQIMKFMKINPLKPSYTTSTCFLKKNCSMDKRWNYLPVHAIPFCLPCHPSNKPVCLIDSPTISSIAIELCSSRYIICFQSSVTFLMSLPQPATRTLELQKQPSNIASISSSFIIISMN